MALLRSGLQPLADSGPDFALRHRVGHEAYMPGVGRGGLYRRYRRGLSQARPRTEGQM
jgi:hypothetical protein